MLLGQVRFVPNPDILGSRSRRQSRYRGALPAAGPVSDADASYQLAGCETANTVIRSSKVRHCASPVSPECQVEWAVEAGRAEIAVRVERTGLMPSAGTHSQGTDPFSVSPRSTIHEMRAPLLRRLVL